MDSPPSIPPRSQSPAGGVSAHVVWDFRSVALPSSTSLLSACHRLHSLSLRYATRIASFRLLVPSSHLDDSDRGAVEGCGVEVEEFNSDREGGAASVFVLTRLCHLALSLSLHPQSASSARPALVLVSGDRDLTSALSMLRSSELFGDVVLVHPMQADQTFLHSATAAVSWPEALGLSSEANEGSEALLHDARQNGDKRAMHLEGEASTDSAQVSPSHSRRSSDSLTSAGEKAVVEEAKTQGDDSSTFKPSLRTSLPVGEDGTTGMTGSTVDELEQFAVSVANMGLLPSPRGAQLLGRDFDYEFHTNAVFPAANQWEQLHNSTSTFTPTSAMQQEGYNNNNNKHGGVGGPGTGTGGGFSSTTSSYPAMMGADHLQQFSTEGDFAYLEAQRPHPTHSLYPHQAQMTLLSHPRFYPSSAQTGKTRRMSSGLPSAPLPLLVQPSIPLPVQSSAAMRATDRPSPRHRQFISVFHRVLAYCEQEKIIPRESVVKKRLLDSKLSIDVDFEEFLQVVEDSGNAVIEGEAPQRVIWPRLTGEGGGARRFACADFFQPSQRLSTEQTHELLMFLGQFQPTIDRGRFGFAQWLARHGPKFIQQLPHGVLVELVQLLLNQKVLLFRKGKVSVSPALNSDPTLFLNAINSAQGAEVGTAGASTSAPITPPHTPPSQPQWPAPTSTSFSHQQATQQQLSYTHQHPHHTQTSQQAMYPSLYTQQGQQAQTAGVRGWNGRSSTLPAGMDFAGPIPNSQYGEFDENDFMGRTDVASMSDLNDRLSSSEGKLRNKDVAKDRLQKNTNGNNNIAKGYKTWSHSNTFSPPFAILTSPQPAAITIPPPNSQSSVSNGNAPLTPLSSSSSSAPSTPLASTASGGSSSPFPHPIGRPRMMSMPPQIPRPPSTLAGQSTPPSDTSVPSRVPSRSSQPNLSFTPSHPSDTVPSSSPSILSPSSQERSPMGGDLTFQTSTRTPSSSQLYSSGSSPTPTPSVGSRKTTPHTSPVLSAQAPSFSTRPSSPFEFGLPLSTVDSVGVLPSDPTEKVPRSSSGLPPVPSGSRVDSRIKVVRSLNISSPTSGVGSPMSHTASLSILSSLASTTSPSVPVTPNSTSFFSSHSPMSQAGGSQPNSADSSTSNSSASRGGGGGGRFYGEEQEGSRPRSVSNPVEPYQLLGVGHVTQHGQGLPQGKRGVVGSHVRHHSSSANQQSYEVSTSQHQREQQLQPQQQSSHVQQQQHQFHHHLHHRADLQLQQQ